jgi:hypothetical protein
LNFKNTYLTTFSEAAAKLKLKTTRILIISYKKLQSAVPVQPWTDPEGSRRLRLPDLSALRTGNIYLPGNIPGTHFC